MKSQPEAKVTLLAGLALIGLAFLLGTGRVAQAQEPPKASPEVQQLKDKLQKLEQTVQELKTQLTELQQPPKTPSPAEFMKPKAAAPPPVEPAETPAPGNTNSPTPGNTTGNTSSQVKGESTFSVYGFAMLDAGYQFKQNHPDWFDTVRPTKLPSFDREFEPNGKTYFGVRQSRLGVKATTPTSLGELKTIFEFELFGTGVDAGQTTFRLRHAYGELGKFGAGQYWTVFGDTDVFPNTIEYWGPNGLVWFRNVQFRWMPIKGRNALTIGLERPGVSGDGGVFADRIELTGIRTKLDMPDLTGNFRLNRDWGHIQFAGLVRRVKWVDTLDDGIDLGGDDVGWGVAISSAPKFGKNDVARLAVVYGEGVQNYFNDAPVDVGVRARRDGDPTRPIEGIALPALGLSAFLDHTWSKRFTTAAGYSLVSIENSNRQAANAYHRGHYAVANLLYTPWENVMVGTEFQYGRRRNWHDDFASEDFRIQFAFKYNFSKTFSFGPDGK